MQKQHPLYPRWKNIRDKCGNSNSYRYLNYGARGIRCEWDSFEEFKLDMYPSYLEHKRNFGKENTTLDRINNNGNYSKENCRWATYHQQANNKRNNVLVENNGKIFGLKSWLDSVGIKKITYYKRLSSGWSKEDARTKPPRR